MPRSDHYAIVIGLSAYPKLGDPPGANLKGPENDADAVYQWLTNPAEGGLPAENVKRVCSRDYQAPPNGAPGPDALNEVFGWLDNIAAQKQEENGTRSVGRRLYFYVSGHGFSKRFREACLLTGDAQQRSMAANVSPTVWLDWLQDAGYFREFVLWMDCCMDRQVMAVPSPAPLLPINKGDISSETFVGFAAPRPLKALEKPIAADGGKYHGVFTWNLLQGLRGAAANSFGMVTGTSLRDWLCHAQLGWLEKNDLDNPDFAKEPAILEHDDGIVFARGLAPAMFNVELVFPPGTGSAIAEGEPKARIWSGSPALLGPPLLISNDRLLCKLPAGLHLVEVPGTPIRHGFAVTRDGTIEAADTGTPPAEATGRLFQVTAATDPPDSTAEIRLLGQRFQTIDTNTGTLSIRVPAGLYAMRIRVGRQVRERVILLDSDWPPPVKQEASKEEASKEPASMIPTAQIAPIFTPFTSAAPLPETAATNERQMDAVLASPTPRAIGPGGEAELMVMARMWTSPAGTPGGEPWAGVTILHADGTVAADLAEIGHRDIGPDPFAICTLQLAPGAYVLRHPGPIGPMAKSLVLPPGGWRLEAYLLSGSDTGEAGTASQPTSEVARTPRITFLMRRIGASWGGPEDLLIEKARVALADERPILNDDLSNMLFKTSDHPLAGIIGGHMILLGIEQGGPQDWLGELNGIVTRLRDMVGGEHPDVEALSLACPNISLRRTQPIGTPPMFERSWRMLCEASRTNPALVPQSLTQKLLSQASQPPFLTWGLDDDLVMAVTTQLIRSLFGFPIGSLSGFLTDIRQASGAAVSADKASAVAAPAFNVGPSLSTIDRAAASERAADLGLPASAIDFLAAAAQRIAPAALDRFKERVRDLTRHAGS